MDLAHRHGIKVILCTVAVNLKDFEPHGSYHRKSLSADEIKAWDELFQAGKLSFAEAKFEKSITLWREAEKIDPEPAELNFCLGHGLLRQGETESAFRHFQLAADHDVFRDRAGSDLNHIVREVAREKGAFLVDAAELFRRASRDGVPGDNLFVDGMHPTLTGQRLIGKEILTVMIENNLVRIQGDWRQHAEMAADAYAGKMPNEYLFSSYFTAASWDAFLGRFARARFWVNKALEYDPTNQDALKLKRDLEFILGLPDPAKGMPWGEVDFALGYLKED